MRKVIDALKGVAPVLAGALAGPAGPIAAGAVKALCAATGASDEKPATLLKALTSGQADVAALRKADLEFQAEMKRNEVEIDLAQLEVNKAEAKHTSVFVAGWRPATGWIASGCMAGIVGFGIYGWLNDADIGSILALYGSTVAPVHLGMLGLRSFEKSKGVHRT